MCTILLSTRISHLDTYIPSISNYHKAISRAVVLYLLYIWVILTHSPLLLYKCKQTARIVRHVA